MQPDTLEASALKEELIGIGVPPGVIHLADNEYVALREDWMISAGRNLRTWLVMLGARYTPEAFDCDDFALLARSIISLWHRRSGYDRGVAFGIIWVARRQHALCLARHASGWKFYEPQLVRGASLSTVGLSREDLESCFFCYL